MHLLLDKIQDPKQRQRPLQLYFVIHNAIFNMFTFLVNCVWGNWSSYGFCNPNSGKQSRSRSKTIVEKNGGSCSGSSIDIRSCAGKTLAIFHCYLLNQSPLMFLVHKIFGVEGGRQAKVLYPLHITQNVEGRHSTIYVLSIGIKFDYEPIVSTPYVLSKT